MQSAPEGVFVHGVPSYVVAQSQLQPIDNAVVLATIHAAIAPLEPNSVDDMKGTELAQALPEQSGVYLAGSRKGHTHTRRPAPYHKPQAAATSADLNANNLESTNAALMGAT